jgi:hypothetical protein
LEHMGADSRVFLAIMKELYRVCANWATIAINVPHPRHDNFIGDPTHVRVISPQVLSLFNKELNDEWQKMGAPNTPLAHYLGVDFVMTKYTTVLDEPYASQHKSGAMSEESINIALREKNNVASEFRIIMLVRKAA